MSRQLERGKIFITSIDEAMRQLSACHMKEKRDAAELLKWHIVMVEQQTDCMVRKIVLDGRNKYIRGSKELQVYGIKITPGASYIPKKRMH